MLGIEKLKEAALAVVNFGEKVENALADGKLSFIEGITIAIGSAPDAFGLIQDGKEIKAEFQDLDDSEREELCDYVASELDLNADGVEEVAEKGFDLLVAFEALVGSIKALKKDQPE